MDRSIDTEKAYPWQVLSVSLSKCRQMCCWCRPTASASAREYSLRTMPMTIVVGWCQQRHMYCILIPMRTFNAMH